MIEDTFLKRHAGLIGGIMIGIVVFAIIIASDVTTRKSVTKLRDRVTTIEKNGPCVDLSAKECGFKIFSKLPPAAQQKLIKRVAREQVRISRQNEELTQPRQNPSESGTPSPGSPPGQKTPNPPSSGGDPSPPSQGGGDDGGGGVTPPAATPNPTQPPVTPAPTAAPKKPTLDIPALDLPPIDVPGVECIRLPLLNPC